MAESAQSSQHSPGMGRVLERIARELRLTQGSAELAELGDRLAALWNTPINEDELVCRLGGQARSLIAAWSPLAWPPGLCSPSG